MMETMSGQGSLSIVHKTPSPKYTEQTVIEVWLKWKNTCFASMTSQKMYVSVYLYMYVYIHTIIETYIYVCIWKEEASM
jgi:hypothetical protein